MLLRTIIVNIAVIIIVFFWSIPLLSITALFDLKVLGKALPWLRDLAEKNKVLKGFIQGTLPTLVTPAFFAMIPKIMTCRYLQLIIVR